MSRAGLQDPRRFLLIALPLAGLYIALFMGRDVGYFDTAELALAAATGGLGHPLGQPLHTLLGRLLIGLGAPPTVALNLLSIAPLLLCAWPLAVILERAYGAPLSHRARLIAPALLILGLSHFAFRETGGRIEVYALAGFFALAALADLGGQLKDLQPRGLARGALWAGLSAAANPIVPLTLLVIFSPALAVAWWRGPRLKLTLAGLGGGLLGLTPYLYLLMVDLDGGAFVWGAPLQGEALRRYLTGADFAAKRATGAAIWGHMGLWLRWAVERGLGPLLLGGLLGWLMSRPRGALAQLVALGGALYFIALNGQLYLENPDYLGYLLPAFGLSLVGLTCLILRLSFSEGAWATPRRRMGAALGLLLLGWVTLSGAPREGLAQARPNARAFAADLLSHAPQGAILILDSDHWIFPALYLQAAEGLRPDLILVAEGLANSSWAWAWLYTRHPDLKPFPVAGPGGRQGRISRFIAAQGPRAVLYERPFGEGGALCLGRWLWQRGASCEGEDMAAAARTLRAHRVSAFPSDRVAARLGVERAAALARAGHGLEAQLDVLEASAVTPPGGLTPGRFTDAERLGAGRILFDPAITWRFIASIKAARGDEAGAAAAWAIAAEISPPGGA
ncbi:DUF2723 domain-containing protein [Myxococcota bacterium]|nr:DUF2723 domain-containing protein [Myxococcota bacterium]